MGRMDKRVEGYSKAGIRKLKLYEERKAKRLKTYSTGDYQTGLIRSAFWLNVIENPTLHGLPKKYESR